MAWEKSSAELIERFDAALPDDPAVERRKMFGYPCAFVNGNMFTGLHQQNLIVRLDEAERTEMMAAGAGAPFEPFPGRRMREYVALPARTIADPVALAAIVAKGLAFAASLPPKPPKKPRKKARAAKP